MICGVSSTVNVNTLKSVSRIHQTQTSSFVVVSYIAFFGGWVVLTKMTPFDIAHTTTPQIFSTSPQWTRSWAMPRICWVDVWNLEANSAIFAWFGWLKPCWNTGVHQLVRTNKGISQLMRRWWDMVGYGGYRTGFLGFQWPFWIV